MKFVYFGLELLQMTAVNVSAATRRSFHVAPARRIGNKKMLEIVATLILERNAVQQKTYEGLDGDMASSLVTSMSSVLI